MGSKTALCIIGSNGLVTLSVNTPGEMQECTIKKKKKKKGGGADQGKKKRYRTGLCISMCIMHVCVCEDLYAYCCGCESVYVQTKAAIMIITAADVHTFKKNVIIVRQCFLKQNSHLDAT